MTRWNIRGDVDEADALPAVAALKHPDLPPAEWALTIVEDLDLKAELSGLRRFT